MYRKLLFAASLMLAWTAQAQTHGRPLMNNAPAYRIAGTPSGTVTERVDDAPVLGIAGNRALLGVPSAVPVDAAGAEPRSSFRAEVRGDVISNARGGAEFGAVQNPDHSSGAFVVSLGVCCQQSAVLFTRRSGIPLAVGRYRISADADGENEILALVLTGSPTRPTGVFHGESGWLVVTAASDLFTAGQFHIDAIGFAAADPGQEDRHVNVTGSFTAAAASSSFRVCEDTE